MHCPLFRCHSCLTQHFDVTKRREDVTVAAHVVQTRKCLNVPDVLVEDSKFPAGIGKRGEVDYWKLLELY